jgi:hypothetical protein
MAESNKINLPEMFNKPFPSPDERLEEAYRDSIVRDRFRGIMHASSEERIGLQAHLDTYLAAAYYLFPEESKIIHDSLDHLESYDK